MPQPWIPPDPDLPSPLVYRTGQSLTAGRLKLVGMDPPSEQTDHLFSFATVDAAVWMNDLLNASTYSWQGFVVGTANKKTIKVEYVPDGSSKTATGTVSSVSSWPVTYGTITSSRSGNTVDIKVPVTTPASGYTLVAMPSTPNLPAYTSQSAYLAIGAIKAAPSGTSTQTLTVEAGSLTGYYVFAYTTGSSGLVCASDVEGLTV